MSRSRPGALAVALLAAALALGLPAGAPAELTCKTPHASDGHEPPCNPALAQSPWASAHRGSYAQASSPYPGPAPGDQVAFEHVRFGESMVPIVMAFSERYPDGGRVLWGSVVSVPENQGIVKIDPANGEIIDTFTRPTGRLSSGTSGAYNLLDRSGHLIVARELGLEVYGDRVRGDRLSPIKRLRDFDLPAKARCRDDDRLIGISMLWDGRVAFASELGVVGVIPRRARRMTAANLRTISLNGDACSDGTPREELEQVSNSIATDENGGIYVVTSEAQYRVNWRDGRLTKRWRTPYKSGDIVGGTRLGAGSGSTPDVIGTAPGDDKFVVITDGREVMHLVLMWRNRIPRGWEPIAPGRPRRIACEVPVTFGDPDATQSVSEQSVLTRGYASVIVNNNKALGDLLSFLPTEFRPLSVLADQLAGNAQPGLERIDWDPETQTCSTVWANRDVVIPNGIPTMSTATGLVYGIGLRGGVWGLEGVSFATGAQKLWVPGTIDPTENSFFAATEIGPGGSVWTGTAGGFSFFKPSG